MAVPPRLVPPLEHFAFGCQRLIDRLHGPSMDREDGVHIDVAPITDAEYRREPVPGCGPIRVHSTGPGPGATLLLGGGDWGLDAAPSPHPWPPLTTIAWRHEELLHHGAEIGLLRDLYRGRPE
jgi:hypothetical protein